MLNASRPMCIQCTMHLNALPTQYHSMLNTFKAQTIQFTNGPSMLFVAHMNLIEHLKLTREGVAETT